MGISTEKAVSLLSQMFLIQFDKDEHEALAMAIDALNENASLRARLDKAVELPCEFGDTVYVLMQRNAITEIVKGTVKNIRRYSGDTWWVEFSDLWVDKTLDDFGKTVFLTEAEAQAKLEEMKARDGE